MTEDEKRRREAELDAFWDIDALIPKKRAAQYSTDTSAAELVLEPPVTPPEEEPHDAAIPKVGQTARREIILPPSNEPKRHFIPPHKPETEKPKPELVYEPSHPLLRRVSIYPLRTDHRYYEGFLRDAVRLYAVKGGECPRATFFSYVPQYSQMTREQLQWYLYWRDSLRNGSYLDTDYSYVLLYLYELINLSDRTDPSETQTALLRVWERYRPIYRQLDSYLPNWICDHGLLHRLPPPALASGELLQTVMSGGSLGEYFISDEEGNGLVHSLLRFCSQYDYRKSKFYIAENRALFDRTVTGAVELVAERVSEGKRLFARAGMDDSRMMRDAYTGALCTHRVKRRIEVEYCSFSRSHELRYFLADVIKHTENRIRAVLGIRSRLTVYALPPSVCEALDTYLGEVLPKKSQPPNRPPEEPAEYEKLYDLPRTALSLDGAAAIERASWQTTKRLIEAFEQDEASDDTFEPNQPIEKTAAAPTEQTPTLPPSPIAPLDAAPTGLCAYASFLRAALEGDTEAERRDARARQKTIDLLADEINTLAAELYGDILLEECDGGFAVIEDYRAIAEESAERN